MKSDEYHRNKCNVTISHRYFEKLGKMLKSK